MEKEFVPYELALNLKELGFNEECFQWYSVHGEDIEMSMFGASDPKVVEEMVNHPHIVGIKAPLWQQAFDWFRNKGYNVVIYKVEGGFWDWDIQDDNIDEDEVYEIDLFQTYEDARLECLKQLIKSIE